MNGWFKLNVQTFSPLIISTEEIILWIITGRYINGSVIALACILEGLYIKIPIVSIILKGLLRWILFFYRGLIIPNPTGQWGQTVQLQRHTIQLTEQQKQMLQNMNPQDRSLFIQKLSKVSINKNFWISTIFIFVNLNSIGSVVIEILTSFFLGWGDFYTHKNS